MVLGFGWRKTRFPTPPAVAGYRRSTGPQSVDSQTRAGGSFGAGQGDEWRPRSSSRSTARSLPSFFLSLLHAAEEKPRGDDEGRKEQERGAARAAAGGGGGGGGLQNNKGDGICRERRSGRRRRSRRSKRKWRNEAAGRNSQTGGGRVRDGEKGERAGRRGGGGGRGRRRREEGILERERFSQLCLELVSVTYLYGVFDVREQCAWFCLSSLACFFLIFDDMMSQAHEFSVKLLLKKQMM